MGKTVRSLIYEQLRLAYLVEPDMVTAGVPRLYQAGSLGVDAVPAKPKKPFVLLRAMTAPRVQEVRDTSQAQRQPFQLYLYDERGSYTRIDRLALVSMQVVEGLAGKQSPSGRWCIGSTWVNLSQDYPDEQYDAIGRFATIELVG